MLCGLAPSMRLPCVEISPPFAGNTPVIRLNIVLLPAPFGPISATISAACTSKDTLLTATTPPNCFRACLTSSSAPCPSAVFSRAGSAAALASIALRSVDRCGSSAISRGQSPPGATCSSSTSSAPNTMVSSCACTWNRDGSTPCKTSFRMVTTPAPSTAPQT
jgi:hypothetical protein